MASVRHRTSVWLFPLHLFLVPLIHQTIYQVTVFVRIVSLKCIGNAVVQNGGSCLGPAWSISVDGYFPSGTGTSQAGGIEEKCGITVLFITWMAAI